MRNSWRLNALKWIASLQACLYCCGCALPNSPALAAGQRASSLIDQGVIELRQGALDRAAAAFLLSLEISPSAAALDGLGCVEFRRGSGAAAERYFIEALDLDPDYPAARGNLALLYEQDGYYAQSKQLFVSALAADPEDVRARNNYGAYLSDEEGDLSGAHDEFLKAASLAKSAVIEENIRLIEAQYEKGSDKEAQHQPSAEAQTASSSGG